MHLDLSGSWTLIDPRFKLQSLQIHPDVLHYSSFAKCNSVYCIFEGDFEVSHFNAGYKQPSSLMYVGSTAVGVAKRHLNRMAVYRRLKKTEFIDAELSLSDIGLHMTTCLILLAFPY